MTTKKPIDIAYVSMDTRQSTTSTTYQSVLKLSGDGGVGLLLAPGYYKIKSLFAYEGCADVICRASCSAPERRRPHQDSSARVIFGAEADICEFGCNETYTFELQEESSLIVELLYRSLDTETVTVHKAKLFLKEVKDGDQEVTVAEKEMDKEMDEEK